MPTPEKAHFGELLAKTILPKVQLIAWLVAAVGLVFHFLQLSGSVDILTIGFSSLAGTLFLSAFAMVQVSPDSQHTTKALLLHKVSHIAASVVLIGALFYLLKMEGYREMLLVGCVTLGGAILVSATQMGNPDNLAILKRPLITTAPVFLLGLYFLYELSSQ